MSKGIKGTDTEVSSVRCKEYAVDPEAFLESFPITMQSELRGLYKVGCDIFGLKDVGDKIDLQALRQQRVGIYPDPDQQDFMSALMTKEEFNENVTDYEGKSINDMCPGQHQAFALLPYQQFLVNFMSPITPYKGLLIFHGVGTGKTSTALSVAENFKETLSLNTTAAQRRVLVLALNKSIDSTFRNTLYNPLLEQIEKTNNMRPGALHPTSDAYFADPDEAGDRRDASRRKYETVYEISDPTTFTKKVHNILDTVRKNIEKSKWNAALRRALNREFGNRLVIVDEVHGIKESSVERGFTSKLKPYDALKLVVSNASNLRLILMTATPMFNDASEAISILNLLLLNDGFPEINSSDVFEDSEDNVLSDAGLAVLRESARPYVSFVRGYNPVSFPEQLEVDDYRIKSLYGKLNPVYLPKPKYDINQKELSPAQHISQVKLIQCVMTQYQFENYLLHSQSRGVRTNVAYKDQINHCNMIYPMGDEYAAGSAGREGFDNCFRLVRFNKATKDKLYRYSRHCVDFLKAESLRKYSVKYWKVLQNLLRSPGLSFIYCENIEIGVETLAMILDANGYEKENGGHYLQDHGVAQEDKVCSLCNRVRKDSIHSQSSKSRLNHSFLQARYVVLQHQDVSTINSDIVSRLKRPTNTKGQEVKVILGSKVTRESFDFSNVRQVHVASAWYNMSKIVQIIGRGVRNCSHVSLPVKERNVVIFRYCVSAPKERIASIPRRAYETETADEYLWRTAQTKDIVIKRIERELKTVAIDCLANKKANVLRGDVNGSRQCDYMNCEYLCRTDKASKGASTKTSDVLLSTNELENIKFQVAKLFMHGSAYTFDQIERHIKAINPKTKQRTIAIALTQMLGSRQTLPEVITGKNSSSGYIIQAADYYVFQPLWAKDKRIPLALRLTLPSNYRLESRVPTKTSPEVDMEEGPEAETILSMIEERKDLILQLSDLDSKVSGDQRIQLLEYLIQNRPEAPLLYYFKNFLIRDDNGKVYGHFLSSVPHCLTPTGWFSCNLEDKKRIDKIVHTLYNEPEADFVGYMQQGKGQPSFKIVNNTSQRDKTRLDLETALNTLTKGKTCGTYDRVILNYIARELGVKTSRDENKYVLCTKLEYAFRRLQLQKQTTKRYFYNIIETEQRKNMLKRRT